MRAAVPFNGRWQRRRLELVLQPCVSLDQSWTEAPLAMAADHLGEYAVAREDVNEGLDRARWRGLWGGWRR